MAELLASTRTSRPRPARARSRSRVDAEHKHDLAKMREEITVATRLVVVCNPNNPTSTALPLEEIAAFVADVPPHVAVILDEAYCEFNILQDPDESIALLKRHPNLVLLRTFSQGLRPVRAARRLRALRLGGLPHRRRPGPPAVLLQRRRPGRRARGAQPPGRGRPPRRAQPRRADRARGRAAPARHRARRVAGQLRLVRPPGRRGRRPRRGRARGHQGARPARHPRPRRRLAGPRRRAARHGRHRGRERALPGRARRAALSSAIPRHAHQHRTARQLHLRRVFLRRLREPFRLAISLGARS